MVDSSTQVFLWAIWLVRELEMESLQLHLGCVQLQTSSSLFGNPNPSLASANPPLLIRSNSIQLSSRRSTAPSSLFIYTTRLQRRPSSSSKMAHSSSSSVSNDKEEPVVQVEKVTIPNNYGEKLAGLLHETGSGDLVILCHGFCSSKESSTIVELATALTKEGISVFRFDFAGNGESEGSFEYGNYKREAEDLRAVILYFSGRNRAISAILGHSKGGNVVLLYASRYHDVPKVFNVSGRYNLEGGIADRLGKEFMQKIKKDGFIDVLDKEGKVQYRVAEESLMERLGTDMHAACLSIDKDCRVVTIHGSADEIIPVEDAFAFDKIIANHQLHIVEGADHCYNKHQAELSAIVLKFMKAAL